MKFSDYLNHRLVEEEFNTLREYHRGDRKWDKINEWYEDHLNDYDYLNENRLDEDDPSNDQLKLKLYACVHERYGFNLLNKKNQENRKIEFTSVPPEFIWEMAKTNSTVDRLKNLDGFCHFVAVAKSGCYSFEVDAPMITRVRNEAEKETLSTDIGLFNNCIVLVEDTKEYYICTDAEKQEWAECNPSEAMVFCYDLESQDGLAKRDSKESFLALIAKLRISTNKNIFALTSDKKSLEFVKDCLEKFKKSKEEQKRKAS